MAIEKALGGDFQALNLCLDRIAPARKERTIQFDLPPIKSASATMWAAARSPRRVAQLLGGNAINEALFARPGIWLTRASVFADAKGIDGAVNGTAAALGGLSGRWRHWQNGFVRSYALSMFAGTLVVIVMLLLVRIA